jgi:uncharacterized protein
MRPVRIAAIALGLLALAALAGVARPEGARSAAAEEQSAITVTGTGTVETVPDEASFSFGVLTKGRTASAALAANSAEARRVIAAIVAAGIDRKDVRTDAVSLSPRTNENGETILGYTAQNSVSVTLRNLDKAGAVIDAAVGAGANDVQGPNLVKSNQDRLYRDALKVAVADARAKAQVLATAAGRSAGRAMTIVESGATPPPVFAKAEAAMADSGPPIEPGTQEIQATVTVTFALS